MNTFKNKLLVSFGSLSVAAFALLFFAWWFQIDKTGNEQNVLVSSVLMDEIVGRVEQNRRSLRDTFKIYFANLDEDAGELASQADVLKFYEKSQSEPLSFILNDFAQNNDLDFAIAMDIDGLLLAASPLDIDHISLNEHLQESLFTESYTGTPSYIDIDKKTTFNNFTYFDNKFLELLPSETTRGLRETYGPMNVQRVINEYGDNLGYLMIGKYINQNSGFINHGFLMDDIPSLGFLNGQPHFMLNLPAMPEPLTGEQWTAIHANSSGKLTRISVAGDKYLFKCQSVAVIGDGGEVAHCAGLSLLPALELSNKVAAIQEKSWHAFAQWLALIGGGVFILILIFGNFISRSITVPLVSITDAITRLANDDPSEIARPPSNTRELGALVNAMDIFHQHSLERRKINEELTKANEKMKRINADLLDAQQAEQTANRAKTEFLSSMSHELRTPMNAIMGFAQLLVIDSAEPLSGSQKISIDHILKGGEHLMELIDDVLELNKIEAGKLPLNIEDIPARDVIDESLDMIRGRADRENIEILDQTSGSDLPLLFVDKSRIRQVLINLLSNAVKYNRKNGTVTVNCKQRMEGVLRISITDTGKGISEEKDGDLFKPFERLGREGGEIEGTGIGLTIAKEIIEQMGAQIDFESKEGKGSTFWIDVPLSREQVPVQKKPKPTDKIDLKVKPKNDKELIRTILYVEDNQANLHLVETIIGRLKNIRLLSAHNAELGIDLAISEKPDLILMDINLPGMSGIEALKHLRNITETKDVPVIAITADVMRKDMEAGIASGFRSYIKKPINVPEFVREIEETLGSAKSSDFVGRPN